MAAASGERHILAVTLAKGRKLAKVRPGGTCKSGLSYRPTAKLTNSHPAILI